MFGVLKRNLSRYLGVPIHKLTEPADNITILCWIHGVRKHKDIIFLDLNDGLSASRLQAVLPAENMSPSLSPGASLKIVGDLVQSEGKKQQLELRTTDYKVLGECDVTKYPFRPKKQYNIEYERKFIHLRPRLERHAALQRIRSQALMAVHDYFKELDFHYVTTPIITSNDCEGAGETFIVSHPQDSPPPPSQTPPTSPPSSHPPSGTLSTTQPHDNVKKVKPPPLSYFPSKAHLSVSSQLHLEAMAHSISRVYTATTAFRAENAISKRHLCEFTMVEAEMVMEELDGVVDVVEEMVRKVWRIVEGMEEDLKVLKTLGVMDERWVEEVRKVLEGKWMKIKYEDAVKEMQGKQLKIPVQFGDDLKVEHETYLIENVAKNRPLVVTHYPRKIKPFYMKTNGDVAECFDVLLPMAGEVAGGSLREDNLLTLRKVIDEQKITGLEWYLDLREYGSIPHGGFGVGFDRLLQFFTQTQNIKEIVPFPRWQRHCHA